MKYNELISIVIPVFNSENSIKKLCLNICEVMKDYKIEIILVNDCSEDKSDEVCQRIIDEVNVDSIYIKLSRNVGEHNALMAGIVKARGEWILFMDDDLQNPPSEALKLVEHATKNKFDVVYGNYLKKKHNFFRNLVSKINNITASIILRKPINLYLSSFKIVRKRIADQIIEYRGPHPNIDGLILIRTSNISSIDTIHEERALGKSGYSFKKLLLLYSNLIINFSTFPIHFFSIAGFIIAFISGIYAIVTIIDKILDPNLPLGYTSLFIAIIFFSGVQLLFLGLLGEYIGKILKNVNKEPQYSVQFIKSNVTKN